MPLSEHQWEITSPDGEIDLVFGTLDTGIQTRTAPDLGQRDIATSDVALPREDGRAFGRDFFGGTSITFEANVLTDSAPEQSDLLNDLRGTWNNEAFRESASAYAILKSCVGGRIRRCHGRPRRFAEIDADLTHAGYTGALFDFATIDGKFYDEAENKRILTLAPSSLGGFTDPITDPITDDADGLSPRQVVISGQRTWAVVTFHGPVTDPVVDFGDFTVGLTTTIAVGESITVDPRPWSRGIYRSDGQSVAGALSYDTPPLREFKIRPGIHVVTYSGTDPTATSSCEITWRNAHDRP